jgi:CheY-like chemotaxis protein
MDIQMPEMDGPTATKVIRLLDRSISHVRRRAGASVSSAVRSSARRSTARITRGSTLPKPSACALARMRSRLRTQIPPTRSPLL